MIDQLLQIIAPHHCCGCGETGPLLCENCKYDIVSEPYSRCISCNDALSGPTGVCGRCSVPYQQAWCVGERHETLQRLIGNYKFTNARAAYRPLSRLLDARLPQLPANTHIVPIPTVSSHIRQRGYDHMELITRDLAKRRNSRYSAVLDRLTTTKQRDATKRQREKQAKHAFGCRVTLDSDATYLLIDDVITTGATMKYAAQVLQNAGAVTVWVASISRQSLD